MVYTSNAAASSGDTIRVRYTSDCGFGTSKAIGLTHGGINPPLAPSNVTVTSIQTNICGLRKYRYSASALLPAGGSAGAATGWLWSLPEGPVGSTGRIDSGTINSQTIVVVFTSNAAASSGDSIRVRYTSDCGLGSVKAIKLTNAILNPPLAPSSVTVTAIQTNICGARKYRYSASALLPATASVGAATGWLWSLPEGPLGSTGTIDSGTINSQTIVVVYTSNAPATSGDSIRVRYTSDCGLSSVKSIKLTNAILYLPPTPSIYVTYVQASICGARKFRYSAPALSTATAVSAAATGWLWSLPVGPVGSTGRIDSGTVNSQTIVVVYTSNAAASAGDTISVRYTSDCGLGSIKALGLTHPALNPPAAPSTLSGTTSICSIVGQSTSARYTTSAVSGAVSYLWTLPSGAVIDSGSNGLKIKIRFITASPNDSIYVQAVSSGGCISDKKVLKLVTTGCAITPVTKVPIPVSTSQESMRVSVFPNPSTTNFNLQVLTSGKVSVNARVLDMQGRFIKSLEIVPNQILSVGSQLKPGMYFIEVSNGKDVKTTRVVKY